VTTTVESVCLPKDSWEKDKLSQKFAVIKKTTKRFKNQMQHEEEWKNERQSILECLH
jgi:hypothetical protein